MFGLRKALVFSTLFLAVISSPAPSRDHHDDSLYDWDQLSALLDSIDTAALHRVLHSLTPKFKDGVFSKDRSAIEHVHSENPIIASKLVHIAKRQSGGNSTTSASVSPSTPQQSSEASRSSSQAASVSSVLSSAIYATTVPAETTVLVAPATVESATPISTQSGEVVYSSYGGGLVTRTSSAVGVRFTRSTSTHLYYTTLPDGTVQTSTSLVVVNAPVTETADATGAAGAAATTGSDPGLQNGAQKAAVAGCVAAIAGAVGFIAAL